MTPPLPPGTLRGERLRDGYRRLPIGGDDMNAGRPHRPTPYELQLAVVLACADALERDGGAVYRRLRSGTEIVRQVNCADLLWDIEPNDDVSVDEPRAQFAIVERSVRPRSNEEGIRELVVHRPSPLVVGRGELGLDIELVRVGVVPEADQRI